MYQEIDPGSRSDAAGGRKPPVPKGLAMQRAVCGVITPQWISLQYASSFFLASGRCRPNAAREWFPDRL